VAEAERQKQTAIIAREAQVQETRIAAQAQADVEAYKVVTQAKAEQDAAEKRRRAADSGRSAESASTLQPRATKRWRWFRSR